MAIKIACTVFSMKQSLTTLALLLPFYLLAQQPTNYVDPFIGTSNYGATNPGAVMPAGMVSVVPFNVAFKKGAENKFEKDTVCLTDSNVSYDVSTFPKGVYFLYLDNEKDRYVEKFIKI